MILFKRKKRINNYDIKLLMTLNRKPNKNMTKNNCI